jgi:predicted protein tyrosine phosphatase
MVCSQLIICSANQVDSHQSSGITHLLTITNPRISVTTPEWFCGVHLCLYFGDVVSEADAAQCQTIPPTLDAVDQALDFITQAWRGSGHVLVHCDYGASRSPALAYVALAKEMGRGLEEEALNAVLQICPDAVPNQLVVKLGDKLLERNGDLYAPVKRMYKALDDEIRKCFIRI